MLFDLNFKYLKPRDIIVTKKGFPFIYLGDGQWRDEASNLTWFPQEPGTYTHYQALELQTKDKRLPTKEELKEAEKHGIREIFDTSRRWFWSASVHPDDSVSVYVFYGSNGGIGYGYRDIYGGSVLCVGR